jgi:hypothetical protein
MYRAVPSPPAAEELYVARRRIGGRALAWFVAVAALTGCTRQNPAFWEREAPDAFVNNELRTDAGPVEPKASPDAAAPDSAPAFADLGVTSIVPVDAGPVLPPLGPRDITVTGSYDGRQYGSNIGTPHTETCPDDQVLVGYRGADQGSGAGDVLTALEAVCGQLAIRTEAASAFIVVEPGITLGVWGSAEPTWTSVCPENEVMVGFGGRAGYNIDQIQVRCAHIELSLSRTLHVGKATDLEPHGGSAGDPILEGNCPPGQIARGHHLRSGFWIDRLGLICGTPSLR